MRVRRLAVASFLLSAAILTTVTAAAQFRQRGGFGRQNRIATPDDVDGRFNFCRIVYRNAPDGDGGGWGVDFPRADINMSIRLSELTTTHISRNASGEPNHLLMRLTDDVLFQCPFVMMTEPGGAFLDDEEAARLRAYVLKGGFLWVDDFWGSYAWEHWVIQLRKALPANEFPIFDLPRDHPLFKTQFEIAKVPQIPSIGFAFNGRGTSERGADSAVAYARAIADRTGRVMVLMTLNTDLGDSWEREGDDPTYFLNFGPSGYAFGINALLYTLTH